MSVQGYEVTTETAPLDPSLHDYSFRLGGRISIKYAVTIRYGSDPGDNRYAFVGIRPD